MLKFKSFIFAIITIATCSCSNDEPTTQPIKPVQPISENELFNLEEKAAIDSFLVSVDSLNATFGISESRGSFKNGAGIYLADAVGHASGGAIGRWVGGALGTLLSGGTPVGTVIGSVVGAKVGPTVCGAVASGVASMWLTQPQPKGRGSIIKMDSSFEIDTQDELADSVGYYHNYIMTKLYANYDKYHKGIIQNTDPYAPQVNVNLIYDDIIKYCKEINFPEISYFEDPIVRKDIINGLNTTWSNSYRHNVGQISYDVYLERETAVLQTTFDMNTDETYLFKNYSGKIVEKCVQLNRQEIHNYAKSLNTLIWESNMKPKQKQFVAKSTSLTINSSLCWAQLNEQQ